MLQGICCRLHLPWPRPPWPPSHLSGLIPSWGNKSSVKATKTSSQNSSSAPHGCSASHFLCWVLSTFCATIKAFPAYGKPTPSLLPLESHSHSIAPWALQSSSLVLWLSTASQGFSHGSPSSQQGPTAFFPRGSWQLFPGTSLLLIYPSSGPPPEAINMIPLTNK